MTSRTPSPGRSHEPSPAELAADIARQREQLAATVDELQEKVQGQTERAKNTVKQAAIVAGVVAVVAAVVVIVVKRRRS